jgi:hypothetical protein
MVSAVTYSGGPGSHLNLETEKPDRFLQFLEIHLLDISDAEIS